MSSSLKKYGIFGWGIGTFLIISMTLSVSAVRRSNAHLEAGRQWEAQGELQRALRHYQWSARAYSPWSNTPHQALEQMWYLAQRVEKSHPKLALEAYELMRGAVWSTRWLMTPYHAWESRVDTKIVELRATPETKAILIEVLATDPRPPIDQSLLLLMSTLMVLSTLIWGVKAGITRELQFTEKSPRIAVWLSISLVLFYLSLKLGVS